MGVEWIIIGEVGTAQGVRGEVRVIPHTEFPERFESMEEIRLFTKQGNQPEKIYPLERVRFHKNFVLLKLAGIDSRDQALDLKGMLIKVRPSEAVELPPDRHYIWQLTGLEVITTEGETLGVITDLLQTGANDVYVVKPNPGVTKAQQILIPVIPDVVQDIDLAEGKVLVSLLPGLVE